MKKTPVLLFLCMLIFGSYVAADNILEKLGLAESTAQRYILNNIAGRHDTGPIDAAVDIEDDSQVSKDLKMFQIPVARLLPAVIKGDRSAAARELCEYIKKYIVGTEFKTAYQKAKDNAKPTSEPERLSAATLQSLKEGLRESEKNYAALKGNKMIPAETLKQFEQSIAEMKAGIAAQSDPTPNKTLWMLLYPEDPELAVKRRLEEYLKLAATVDFNAVTTGAGKNKQFVNATYEHKSVKWKAIYRAGKEVNDIAGAFARQWIIEINARNSRKS